MGRCGQEQEIPRVRPERIGQLVVLRQCHLLTVALAAEVVCFVENDEIPTRPGKQTLKADRTFDRVD